MEPGYAFTPRDIDRLCVHDGAQVGARLSLANALHLVVLAGEGVGSSFCPSDKSKLP